MWKNYVSDLQRLMTSIEKINDITYKNPTNYCRIFYYFDIDNSTYMWYNIIVREGYYDKDA